jgi:hypothetical protein
LRLVDGLLPAFTVSQPPQPPTQQQSSKRHWPVFLVGAVTLIGCGYAIASLWKYVYYPTIDLVRTVKFSACDAEGIFAISKVDYTVVRNLFGVVDPNSGTDGKIAVSLRSNTEREPVQSYTFPVRNFVEIKWVRSKGQPSEWILRNFTVNYTLPTGRQITGLDQRHNEGGKGPRCFLGEKNTISCPNLYTTDEAQTIRWYWNYWDGCKE